MKIFVKIVQLVLSMSFFSMCVFITLAICAFNYLVPTNIFITALLCIPFMVALFTLGGFGIINFKNCFNLY